MTNLIKTCDVFIIGTGIAGVYTALNIRKDLNVLLITKESLRDCNSYLAQGGISTALNEADYEDYFQDTLRAGNYKNNKESVEILIKESRDNIKRLENLNVNFDKLSDNSFEYTREGGHSKFRIVHIKDETGKYVMETLYNELDKRDNISLLENCSLSDIIKKDDKCLGGICTYNSDILEVHSTYTIIATGGLGGLFSSSTNVPTLTGDGINICLKHDIELMDMDYLQLHPTVLYEKESLCKRLLLSESLRGEGAKLRNLKGEEFIDPLKPRDVVSKAILNEIKYTPDSPYVYLDLTHLDKDFLVNRFPFLYNQCLEKGYAMEKDMIPVSPAHHFLMGGIKINSFGETTLPNLFALGETACTGVHGNNRLASNSLLEGLVFGYRCANKINNSFKFEREKCNINHKDLIDFLKERLDENYVKLLNNR